MASAPTLRPCAAHPEKGATETCARCGSYVCLDCFDYASVEPEWCADCRGRTGVERVPWERTDLGWGRRAVDTVVGMVRTPQRYLRYADRGELAPALTFVGAVGVFNGSVGALLQVAIFLVLGGIETPGDVRPEDLPLVAAAVVLFVPVQAGLSVLWSVFWGGTFHLGTRLVGAKGGSAKAALKAVAYLHAYFVAALPVTLLASFAGSFASATVALVLVPFWMSVQLSSVVTDHYGVPQEQAWIAGFFPLAIFLVCFCAVVLGATALIAAVAGRL